MIPIFIISLKRTPERLEKCQSSLKELGINNAKWFPAIDGKTDDLSKFNISRKKFQIFWHNWFIFSCSNVYFSDTEYACSLSHLSLYQKMVDEDIEMAVILEDDAFLHKEYVDFVKNLEETIKSIEGCDILYLYCDENFKSRYVAKPTRYGLKLQRIGAGKLDCILNRRKNVHCTAAYVITKKAAKRLLDIGYPVRAQADVLLGSLSYNKLVAYKTIPMVFKFFDLGTTITHAGEMPENVKPWYSRLAKRIKKLYHK